MSETSISAHQEDLAALLEVLAGKTSQDPILATQDFLQKYPDRAEGYFVLGVLTYLSGYVGDATHMIEKAHDLDPDVREYAVALASLYAVSDRVNDALYFAKLGTVLESHPEMAGILPPNLKNFVEAASHSVIHKNYVAASLAFTRREFELATSECELELKMDPNYVPALELYAKALIEMGEHGSAVPILQRILQLKPDDVAENKLNLAEAIFHLGLFEQAKDYIEAVVQGKPDSIDINAKAFYLLSGMENGEPALSRAWSSLQQSGLHEVEPFFPYTPSDDGKIRIGFLSDKCFDCFEGSVLSSFLRRFDKKILESYVYIQNINKDSVTQAIKNWAVKAREVFDVNDKTLALILQRDRVDILVDMCGFGPNQRLSLLAHKPCGQRLSWLAPLHGGGQPGIDTVVTDESTDVAQSRFLQNGQDCMKLRTPVFANRPVQGFLDPVSPPNESKGYVTFGAYLDFCALAGRDGALWMRLLDSVPGSKLRLHIGSRISEISLARLNEIFEPKGLLDRVDLYTPDEDERPGSFFDHVDVFLASQSEDRDRIVQALWMGVPCLTKSGVNDPYVTYSGALLRAAGIPSWACEDDDAFLSVAKALAFDPAELAGLRKVLRGQLAKSRLMDLSGFALEFQSRLAELFFRKIQKR
ncbi:MAG: tetratricopeptide repeat protein [Rhodospirillales bacterium]|nr:tetratricopeptide repeat protein [Rhodospirillales bacterium]